MTKFCRHCKHMRYHEFGSEDCWHPDFLDPSNGKGDELCSIMREDSLYEKRCGPEGRLWEAKPPSSPTFSLDRMVKVVQAITFMLIGAIISKLLGF